MNNRLTKHPVLTASALGLLLTALPLNGYSATTELPPEVLKQLQELSRKVQELEKQVAQQNARNNAPVYQKGAATKGPDVSALEQKVLVLERKQEIADEELTKQKKEAPVVIAGDKGFGLKSADGKYEIKLRGLLQQDARNFNQGIKGQHAYLGDTQAQQDAADDATHEALDNYISRRARPIIEGKFNDIYGFRLQTDFGNGTTSSTNLVDAYVDANYHPAAKIRVGKFTPGFSLERLQSSDANKVNELGLQSNFAPSRDQGAQIAGDIFNNTLNYSLGIFNGANDGANGSEDSNTDKEINARLFASPFANNPGFLQGLGFGVGLSTTSAKGTFGNTSLASYKTFGQENFFSYRTDTSVNNTVFADGDRTRVSPQVSYYNGSFGLTSEYIREQQDTSRIYGAGITQRRTDQLTNDGWDATASYILTGEDASFKSVKPAKPFDPANGGWGAWEVVATTGQLDIDKGAFYDTNGVLGGNDSFAQATRSAKAAKNYGVGVNWYLNNVLRLSLDYNKTSFDWGGGGTSLAPQDREDENVFIGRVQAAF
ncbi:MAG TPA: porin [Pseudomonadales bacterium]|nr:porin [Pseudomonadales bacterium]